MKNFLSQRVNNKLAVLILGLVFAGTVGLVSLGSCDSLEQISFSLPRLPRISLPRIPFLPSLPAKEFKKFSSEQEFKTYLEKGKDDLGSYYGLGAGDIRTLALPEVAMPFTGEKGTLPERVSETNVQVAGIDEPDIVKTDGKEIYFSKEGYWRGPWPDGPMPMTELEMMPEFKAETKLIKAFPPNEMALDSKIEKGGNLLLSNNILVVFSNQEIIGYDVKDPKSPQKKWEMKLENNTSLIGSRLAQGKIYLVTRNYIDEARPCPIEILKAGQTSLEIRCIDIYHPISIVPVDAAFTALRVNPVSGQVEKTVSFVGSSGDSVLYVSPEAIFATYSYNEDFTKFFLGFLEEKAKDLFPNSIKDKLEKLAGYDISQQAKMMELQLILEKYQSSLKEDERLKLENELTNRISAYLKDHKRDLEKTGIVKIGLNNLEVFASGNVPGRPLNQFSLDEYQGSLRIATTVGRGWWGWGLGSGAGESANDVYVLDKNLKIQGEVRDLGLTEMIYSVRFVEDKGYVVTFRQIDPFYVLDLSDPRNPQLKGELKIPGFSSYLQPISKDRVLGIGKEDWKVKVSLFDVANPAKPQEIAKYILDEGWSEIQNTHHAFLLDKKHEIFFLPGGKGGYVFSYKDGNLEMKKAVSNISAKRAIYLDDYLYIIGDDKIVVLNELDWARVNEINL